MSTDTDRIEDALRNIQIAKRVGLLFLIVVLVLFAWFFTNALSEVGFSISEIVEYWPEFIDTLGNFFPLGTLFGIIPFVDISQYWAFIQEQNLLLQLQDGNPVLGTVFVTFAMGFVGTVLGIPGALILGVLGSERVMPYPFSFIFRGTVSVIRAVPALVWALIYIPLGGVSPFTATLTISTDTTGNLGRLFTDALEEVEDGLIEATRSTDTNSPQKVVFGMFSQVFMPFVAWTMYILEISVRIGVTMELIGGGDLGQMLQIQHGLFWYTNMMAMILVVFILITSAEFVSQRVRSYIRGNEEGTNLLKLIVKFPQRIARSIWE